MNELPRAIVLGVDTPIGLAVVRELGERRVFVHGIGRDAAAIGRASRWCQSFSVRPVGPLATWLPELIATTGAGALLAISEDDLVALAALEPLISGCRILTPRAGPLANVLDKTRTLDAAQRLGFDTPASWQPVHGEDVTARIATLMFPVVLKWADPPAIVQTLAAHQLTVEKAEHVADAEHLATTLARYNGVGQWPLVQSFCPGTGLGQMLHMKGGRATLKFQHRRIHEWPPEGGVSTLCQSVPLATHADQMAKSEGLLASIGWEGPAMVEYRYDATTRRYWLMEINGRFWGSLPLASACGANFGWETYAQAMLGDATAIIVPKPRRARYMIPETRRLLHILFRSRSIAAGQFNATPWRDLISYITGFFDPSMRYFVFSWRDPGPFVADLRNIIRKSARRETLSPD